jgi:hypothetical protein
MHQTAAIQPFIESAVKAEVITAEESERILKAVRAEFSGDPPNINLSKALQMAVQVAIEESELPLFITQRNFAKRVGVCRSTVADWTGRGLIPMVQPPGCNRAFVHYPKALRVLRQWLENPPE